MTRVMTPSSFTLATITDVNPKKRVRQEEEQVAWEQKKPTISYSSLKRKPFILVLDEHDDNVALLPTRSSIPPSSHVEPILVLSDNEEECTDELDHYDYDFDAMCADYATKMTAAATSPPAAKRRKQSSSQTPSTSTTTSITEEEELVDASQSPPPSSFPKRILPASFFL